MVSEFKKELPQRLIWLIVTLVFLSLYILVNRLVNPHIDFTTRFDQYIPFVPIFVIFYLSYFIFLVVWIGYAFLRLPLAQFKKISIAIIIVQVIAYAFHLLFPGLMPRPEISDIGWIHKIVLLTYLHDKPTNLFPSLHVANTFLLYLYFRKISPKLITVWAIGIIASTILIKQHTLLDVASGIILSSAVYFFFKTKKIINL